MLLTKIIGILIIGICFYIGLGYCAPIVIRDGIEAFKSAYVEDQEFIKMKKESYEKILEVMSDELQRKETTIYLLRMELNEIKERIEKGEKENG